MWDTLSLGERAGASRPPGLAGLVAYLTRSGHGHRDGHSVTSARADSLGVRYNVAMKRAAHALIASLLLLGRSAAAQDDEPAPPLPPPTPPLVTRPVEPAPAPPHVAPAKPADAARPAEAPPEHAPAHRPVPPERTGFAMALRTGLSIPMGKVSSGNPMYDTFSPQVPLLVDLGFKPVPHLFLGAYLGLAVGDVHGRLGAQCDRMNAQCASARVLFGLEAQYQFAPARRYNPWLGYGLGFEGAGVGNTVGHMTTTTVFTGFDFARFSGGFDVRISRVIGVGPLVDLTLGRYTHTSVKLEHTTLADADVDDKRVHGWLTLGGRLVFFP